MSNKEIEDLKTLIKALDIRLRNEELSQEEYDNLQIQKATHQLTNPLRLRFVRREIARVKTFIRQHELGINVKTENA